MERRKPISHKQVEALCRKIDSILEALDEISTTDHESLIARGWAFGNLLSVKEKMLRETRVPG